MRRLTTKALLLLVLALAPAAYGGAMDPTFEND